MGGKLRLVLIVVIIVLLAAMNLGQSEFSAVDKPIKQATTAKAHVNFPNYEVLDDRGTEVFTVIFKADVPDEFEGSLLRLKNSDLGDIEMILKNLDSKKIIFYSADNELAQNINTNAEIVIV